MATKAIPLTEAEWKVLLAAHDALMEWAANHQEALDLLDTSVRNDFLFTLDDISPAQVQMRRGAAIELYRWQTKREQKSPDGGGE